MSSVVALEPLPIDSHLEEIVRRLRERRAIVITAAPGAGKTTRVPPALVADGPVILLQPRRVAARAIARRIASEHGWTIGREVGWHVRFERQFSKDTRLLVATEGVLTARLQQDPTLDDFRTVVIDEFHERSVHADLGLALAKQAWLARDDLRLVVMSATLDARQVATFLGECPIVDVPGRTFPLDVSYRPGVAIEQAVLDVHASRTAARCSRFCRARRRSGARSIDLRRRCRRRASTSFRCTAVSTQTSRTRRCGRRPRPRVILATNIAETTLTVPDVRDGRRHGAAQSRALRSGARDRQPRDRADLARFGRSARGSSGPRTRRARRSVCGTRAIGCGRTASRTSRASIWRRSCSICWRGARRRVRSSGSRRRRRRPSTPPWRCCAGSTRSTPATGSPRWAGRSCVCRCTRALDEFSWRRTARPKPREPARGWRSATSCRPTTARRRATCWRRSIASRRCRRTSSALPARSATRTGARAAPIPSRASARRRFDERSSPGTPIAWPGGGRRQANASCWRQERAPGSRARAASTMRSFWSPWTSPRGPEHRALKPSSAWRRASSASGSTRPRARFVTSWSTARCAPGASIATTTSS